MEFASATFLFIFLPAVFLLYFAIPVKQVRKWLLIAASLLFYAWGGVFHMLLMVFSSAVNFFLALWIGKKEGNARRAPLVIAIVFNIGLLAVFKYSGFLMETVNSVLRTDLPVPSIASPLGISFFTFQALSFVIDVYRKKAEPTRNFGKFLLYISFFAQLVQGPIIRWNDIEAELDDLKFSARDAAEGLRTFIIGLSMKLIIANTLGRVTTFVFGLEAAKLNAAYAWVGAAAFLFRIYFDFAGYSKMAIGLGRMFGVTVPVNFNYPYIAYSMTDFWRRWHITLSLWFRDYVYIPLGGNRKGALRTGLNKVIVFILTGLWHGPNLTFAVWGLYNGAFLLGENFVKKTRLRIPKPITWVYTILAVTVGFVIFNSKDLSYAWAMISSMFSRFSIGADTVAALSEVLRPTVIAVFFAAVAASTPIAKFVSDKLDNKPVLGAVVKYGAALLLFTLCVFYIASGNYNPSIYTKF